MRIDPTKIRELKEAVDIVSLVGRYVKLRPSGILFKGLCPFHSEKTPSFYVYPDRGSYICYGCGEHGDAIDFLMKQEGLTFGEAARRLSEETGIKLEPLRPEQEERLRKEELHTRKLLETNEVTLSFFRRAYASQYGEHARQYVHARGISQEMVDAFELGFAPESWDALVHELSRRGLVAYGVELGLLRARREGPGHYSFFRNRLVFPIRDHQGRLVGFGARSLDPEAKEAKYVNSPESRIFQKNRTLYGLRRAMRAIRTRGRAILVEGNVDVIRLHQSGFEETVAPLGTAFTQNHAQLLKRYTEEVLMIFDGDEAGRKATLKSVPIALSEGLRVKVLLLPEGHDPDSFLSQHGSEEFAALLSRVMDGVEAYMDLSLAPRTAPVQDRFSSLRRLVPVLQPLDRSVRDIYLEQAAILLDLPVEAVRRAYDEVPVQGSRASVDSNPEPRPGQSGRRYTRDEATEISILLYLFAMYAAFPGTYDEPSSLKELHWLHTDMGRYLLRMFMESNLHTAVPEEGNDATDEEWKQLLGNLYNRFVEYKNTALKTLTDESLRDRAFEDILKKLELNHINHMARELEGRLVLAKRAGNEQEVDEILQQKFELERRRVELKKHRKG